MKAFSNALLIVLVLLKFLSNLSETSKSLILCTLAAYDIVENLIKNKTKYKKNIYKENLQYFLLINLFKKYEKE